MMFRACICCEMMTTSKLVTEELVSQEPGLCQARGQLPTVEPVEQALKGSHRSLFQVLAVRASPEHSQAAVALRVLGTLMGTSWMMCGLDPEGKTSRTALGLPLNFLSPGTEPTELAGAPPALNLLYKFLALFLLPPRFHSLSPGIQPQCSGSIVSYCLTQWPLCVIRTLKMCSQQMLIHQRTLSTTVTSCLSLIPLSTLGFSWALSPPVLGNHGSTIFFLKFTLTPLDSDSLGVPGIIPILGTGYLFFSIPILGTGGQQYKAISVLYTGTKAQTAGCSGLYL